MADEAAAAAAVPEPAGDAGLPRSRKILVAVDESEESMGALTWALDNHIVFPRDHPHISNTLTLLHVQPLPQAFLGPVGPGHGAPGYYITPELIQSVAKHQDDISKSILLRAKKICEERNVRAEKLVASGDAREVICEVVEKIHPAFLVIGSHGYGAIKRTFLGSVSDYCAHHAKCPVMIVKKTA